MTQSEALAKQLEEGDLEFEVSESVPPTTGRLAVMVRKAREKKGLSQRNLAETAGVSNELVRRFEAGECDPKFSIAVQLCRVLNLDIGYVMDRAAYGQMGAKSVQQGE